jgi:hypothetical protein
MSTPMQATPYVHLLMSCQNPGCREPIPLPGPTIQDESSNQSEWPTAKWKRFFLCAKCGHGYEYSNNNILQVIQETADPWTAGTCLCYAVQFECVVRNCDTHITSFVIADSQLEASKVHETLAVSARARFDCPNEGHLGQHHAVIPDPEYCLHVYLCSFPF